jgi:hypothetical protein
MTRPAFITSVRIEKGDGPHEYVSVWIRGANVGTLCVREGEGEHLSLLLRGCRCLGGFFERHGEHMLGCPIAGLGDRVIFETAIEAGIGAPAPSRDDASKAGVESRPSGVPPAAGAPPTSTGTHEPEYPRTEGR